MNSEQIGNTSGRSVMNNVISFLEWDDGNAADRVALLWLPPQNAAAWLLDRSLAMHHDRMTFSELAKRSESAAAGLKELGLCAGDRIFLFVPMSPELYVAMFAIQRIGAIAVFLDSWARRDHLAMCGGITEPEAVIAPEPAYGVIADVPEFRSAKIHIVVGPHKGTYSASLEQIAEHGASCPIAPLSAEDTALITFTTGSSGAPKGANRTHGFLAAQHRALDRCLPYQSDDIDLPVFPIFSLNNMAGGVTTALPAINLAAPAETDGAILVAQLRSLEATCCTLSPSLLLSVARAAIDEGQPLMGLRRIATGGAPISRDDVHLFRRAAPSAELHVLYGSTEVEPIAHLTADEMPAENGQEGVCVGRIAEGLDYRLIRLHREPITLGQEGWAGWVVTSGDVGELIVSGEHVCRDYYRNPEAFRAAKIVEEQERVWHRTGDLCRVDPQGRLWVVGRLHNAICRAGKYLFPVKPEVVMKRLEFVRAAAYLGLPDVTLGERAVAVFSVRAGARHPDCASIVRRVLADESVPADEVVEVEDIPLDPRHHSKVEYHKLREILMNRARHD